MTVNLVRFTSQTEGLDVQILSPVFFFCFFPECTDIAAFSGNFEQMNVNLVGIVNFVLFVAVQLA